MKMWCPAKGWAHAQWGNAVCKPLALPVTNGENRISSLEHIQSTTESVESPARVAIPRRGTQTGVRSRVRSRLERIASTRGAPIVAFAGLLAISLAFKVRGLGSA